MLESIDNILKVTEDTFRAGDHSVSKIDKQINPFEKTNGLIGILPTNVTAGLSIGYKLIMIKYYYLHILNQIQILK